MEDAIDPVTEDAVRPGTGGARPLLEVDDLSVAYGPIVAVRNVSLTVTSGEIVTLLGPNGAGKTTLLHAVMGLVPPAGGHVRFVDDDITTVAPEGVVRRGLTLCPEGRHVFADLSVADNLRLGAVARRDRDKEAEQERMVQLFPILEERWQLPAGKLSGGEQQMLAIARSLMSQPHLLMLDEPSLGLAPYIVDEIFDLLGTLRAGGLTILLVEQNAEQALGVADRAYVLNTGRLTFAGTTAELRATPDLMQTYVGVGIE